MPSASSRRSRCSGLFMIFCSSSTSERPRVMTARTSGFSSHHGWTWMWASVTAMAAEDSSGPVGAIMPAMMPSRALAIAVVEDDRQTVDLLHRLLGSAGYRIVHTSEARDAADLVRREAPALVLLNVDMPGMDGYAVLKELQADAATAGVPVVFLSPNQEFSERIRAFRHGVIDYLTRPLTPEVALRKIEKAIEGRAAGARPAPAASPAPVAAVAPAASPAVPTVTEVGPHAETVDPPRLPDTGTLPRLEDIPEVLRSV